MAASRKAGAQRSGAGCRRLQQGRAQGAGPGGLWWLALRFRSGRVLHRRGERGQIGHTAACAFAPGAFAATICAEAVLRGREKRSFFLRGAVHSDRDGGGRGRCAVMGASPVSVVGGGDAGRSKAHRHKRGDDPECFAQARQVQGAAPDHCSSAVLIMNSAPCFHGRC